MSKEHEELPRPEQCTLEQLEQYLQQYNLEYEDGYDDMTLGMLDGKYCTVQDSNDLTEDKEPRNTLLEAILHNYLGYAQWKPKQPIWPEPYVLQTPEQALQRLLSTSNVSQEWRDLRQVEIDREGRKIVLSYLLNGDRYACNITSYVLDYLIEVDVKQDIHNQPKVIYLDTDNQVNTHFTAFPGDRVTVTATHKETKVQEQITVAFPDSHKPSEYQAGTMRHVPFIVKYDGPVTSSIAVPTSQVPKQPKNSMSNPILSYQFDKTNTLFHCRYLHGEYMNTTYVDFVMNRHDLSRSDHVGLTCGKTDFVAFEAYPQDEVIINVFEDNYNISKTRVIMPHDDVDAEIIERHASTLKIVDDGEYIAPVEDIA